MLPGDRSKSSPTTLDKVRHGPPERPSDDSNPRRQRLPRMSPRDPGETFVTRSATTLRSPHTVAQRPADSVPESLAGAVRALRQTLPRGPQRVAPRALPTLRGSLNGPSTSA